MANTSNSDYMYRRMMRQALAEGDSLGGGQRPMGLFDIISSGINGYKAAKQEHADEDLFEKSMQAEYAAGVRDPQQALYNVMLKNPVLLGHDFLKDNSTAQEFMHHQRQYFAAGPGSTIFDAQTGQPTSTVPGKPGLGFSSEVQQALVAAGWKGDTAPTDQQYANAAKLLGQHLQRPLSEFEDIMSHLSGTQRQQYLEHLAGNNPNSGVANELTKLNTLADQATAAGRNDLAQQYRTAAQKLSQNPGIMSLLSNDLSNNQPSPTPSGAPQPPVPSSNGALAPNPSSSGDNNAAPPVPPEKPPVPSDNSDADNSNLAAPPSPAIDPQAIVNELRSRGIQIQ